MERSTEIADAVRSLYTAVNDGDAATLTGLVSARDGLVFIGTDPDEWFDESETVFAMLKAQASAGVKVRGGDVAAYEEGTVGWAADRGAFIMPDNREVPFRITAVFHREQGAWKMVQEHASVAISNEDALGVEI
jgi:hypothetical protein